MKQRRCEVELLDSLCGEEALALFQMRGGEIPGGPGFARIDQSLTRLAPDLPIGSWLLCTESLHYVARSAIEPDDWRDRDFSGDLCAVWTFPPNDRARGMNIHVRRVWSENGPVVRIVHPSIDWAPGNRGPAPGEQHRIDGAEDISIDPYYGVLTFDNAPCGRYPRRRALKGHFLAAAYWRGVAGRIMPALSA